ncbi:MAG: tyrosine-type recombinase/integrase, partial [Hylemonella sp.]
LDHQDLAGLDLRTLRSWLAQQQSLGRSRTTIARRATAARVFTAWLARSGRIASDVGASLGSPKAHRTLPAVLRVDEARALVEAATELALDGSPTGLRDVAILELLYATGIRVGELVGLDIDDLDRERNVVRVLGKGRKERMAPFGGPAAQAVDRWLSHGRPLLRVEGA